MAELQKEETSSFCIKSILCKPIRNADQQIIGVAQLINKLNDCPFDDHDDQLFEAFTIFCGLGINNCLLYDEVSKSAAKQAVALEVLSYHASVSTDEIAKVKLKTIPTVEQLKLNDLEFNDFALSGEEMVMGAIRIFKHCGFLQTFRIEYETVIRWLLTVRKNYRNIAYHNWRHAFNVCQVMFALLQTCNMKTHLDDLEMLALITGCLCHDLDHRGTNNAFLQKSSSALSQLYGTKATLEHHHFNHAVMILNSEGHNIFSNLSSEDYSHVMNLLKHAILATDLSKHLQVRKKFFPLIESGLFNFDDPEQRELLRSVLMTSCDIASICKPWHIQRQVADLVVSEFFQQGDKEKELKIKPQALMDREKKDELPNLQIGWIDGVCLPLYKTLERMDPVFQPMLDRVLDNRTQWQLTDRRRVTQGTSKETDV